jgi:hypothetical protein
MIRCNYEQLLFMAGRQAKTLSKNDVQDLLVFESRPCAAVSESRFADAVDLA